MTDVYSELASARDIAEETGEILLSYFRSDRIDIQDKGPRDRVTAADLAAERHATARLRSLFPHDGIVAEEGSNVEASVDRCWYLDPLDGTMNFSRGIGTWCVSLALYEGGRPLLGVIRDPLQDETFTSIAGEGARCNGAPIRGAPTAKLSDAFVHLTVDFNDASMLEGVEDLSSIAPRVMRTRNIGSAALALAYVAAGRFDAMLHRSAHMWDYAAGVALLMEAGGAVTDMNGASFSAHSISMAAACNNRLRHALLDLVNRPVHSRLE